MGVYGEISHFLSDPTEISFQLHVEITSNKKVIAKKPLTNLYEMSSSCSRNVCFEGQMYSETYVDDKGDMNN